MNTTNPTMRHGFITLWQGVCEIAVAFALFVNDIVKKFPWAVVIVTIVIAIIASIFVFCQSRYEVNTVEHERDSLYQIVHSYEEALPQK